MYLSVEELNGKPSMNFQANSFYSHWLQVGDMLEAEENSKQ
jgi:hypothetical protein